MTTVYETSSQPVVAHDATQETATDNQEKPKKTRRSRRGGYRRKRQQQRKVQALIAASAAAKAAASSDDSASTATTEEESSSCEESTGGSSSSTSPQRSSCARKRNQNTPPRQPAHYYYGQPVPSMQTAYAHTPVYNNNYGYPPNDRMARHAPGSSPQQRPRNIGTMASPPQQPYTGKKVPSNNTAARKEPRSLTKEEQDLYLAMDCEMVGVGTKGSHSALARVTLIDWHGNTVMDELVRPQWEVTDYRTFVSGITPEMLDSAQMDFSTCQKLVLRHLEGKILVGHALKNDMGVLGITTHPWHMIRDTAKYAPFMQDRYQDGLLWPRSLKRLSKELLGREVQEYGRPHCPKEDALAALDLYRTVWPQWEQCHLFWGL